MPNGSNIKLIIGLGNPGPEYEKTRHNVGRDIVLSWQKKNELADFNENKKMFALISENKIGKNKVILTLPETFMNNSGKAIAALSKFYKIKPDLNSVIIIHDDMDIPAGKMKISVNKSAGGHKGVASVLRALKTENVTRFRIGTWKAKKWHERDLNKLVVAKFSPSEQLLLKKSMKMAGEALSLAANEGIEKAMNEYNSRN
ncbi:MAG: aminoacyl-tRNA hydrolase [Candidatus Terrybacteria bacterium RIFCSPLOWO2_01_FULL_40_23]|uniref:Peptidyl-tRNA hydrolase n=1 Tax=Candidatus Terrybacteria bacterium RIFCSPLOWO2_01_FULL_40_23 TaxID=1802366 RepID=A0A1G2PSB4_9BACT|nr:MAG: aminoacyl-tRNA hydrolase [Candidatus Terrybacteria bacterium RIFCSPLOWO2_01_FULL_40_23]